jgi:DNA-binding NarL/FixJ family response regulator
VLHCVIIDSHESTRVALYDRFAESQHVVIDGCAATPPDGARLISEHRPDVAIVDVVLRPSGRLATLEELDAYGMQVPIVAFSAHVTAQHVSDVFRGGARAFVAKDAPEQVLEAALAAVAAGHCFLDPEITVLLLDASTKPSTASERSLLTGDLGRSTDGEHHGRLRFEDEAANRSLDSICQRLQESGMPESACTAIAAGLRA